MKERWLIKRIKAVEYYAHGGSYVLGIPQPTAISGWIHAWTLRLVRTKGLSLDFNMGFVYAIDQYGGTSGISLNKRAAFGGAKAKAHTAAAIVDRARSTVEFSIIVEMDEGSQALGLTEREIRQAIESTRLLGASLFIPPDAIERVDSLNSGLRRLGVNAFVLSDATQELVQELELTRRQQEELAAPGGAEGGETQLDEAKKLASTQQEPGMPEAFPPSSTVLAMARLFARPTDGAYKARFVPVVSGYRLLKARRDSTKDASDAAQVAEPIVSAARFQSKVSALSSEKMGSFQGLWRSQTDCGAGLWRLSGETSDALAQNGNDVEI